MKLVKLMEWLFGCPWNERAEKSMRDKRISEENARYGQLTSIAYEETLKGMANASKRNDVEEPDRTIPVEIANSLMAKLGVLDLNRNREIARINEEFEQRKREMSMKSKWLLPRLWHEWRSK